jgi:hypothetical protein
MDEIDTMPLYMLECTICGSLNRPGARFCYSCNNCLVCAD